jgi:hypothetical protein
MSRSKKYFIFFQILRTKIKGGWIWESLHVANVPFLGMILRMHQFWFALIEMEAIGETKAGREAKIE